MKEFFTYYTNLRHIDFPIIAFSSSHFILISIFVVLLIILYKKYSACDEVKQRKFQIVMAVYFILEELFYNSWVLSVCKSAPWQQILPFHLCTACVYISTACVILKKDWLRFFCAIICTLSGLIAIIYPANIDAIYPIFHYRTINFFMLHFSFILFGMIQLRYTSIMKYRYIFHSMCILSSLVIVAFITNCTLGTDYMFIENPPKISIIRWLYDVSGVFFIPAVIMVLTAILMICVKLILFAQHRIECKAYAKTIKI